MDASQVVNGAPVHCSEPPRIAKEQTSLSDRQGGDYHDHPTKPVIIKIEEDDEDDDNELVEERETETNNFTVTSMGGGGGNGWSASSSSSAAEAVQPRPVEGLHEAGPPPFLKKTFEMVEDRGTDGMVSWSESGRSFVVWDQHRFSRDILPKYFKHNNFSSFIRQLNTYGFRKIDPDRWDFEHEFFQRGKKPLLKNIRRRARPSHPRLVASTVTVPDGKREVVDVEAEAEILKRDQDKLRIEILELRQQQDISQSEISSMEERIQRAENRHQHMFLFLTRAVKNPNFVRKLIHRKRSSEMRQLEMASGHIKKRPRQQHMAVDATEATEFLIKVMKPDLDDDTGKEIGGFRVPHGEGFIGCEAGWVPASASAGGLADVPDAYQIVTENLLGDSGTMENDEITEALKDSDLYMEFEGLIRKSQDWDGYGNEFLEPAAIGLMP